MLYRILYYLGFVGIAAHAASSLLPWTWHAELNEHFGAFFSHDNYYGRPGILLLPLAAIIFVFMLVPKVWAKRTNLFLAAILVGFAVRTYLIFSSGYNGYQPVVKPGMYLMLFSTVFILLGCIFPRLKVATK